MVEEMKLKGGNLRDELLASSAKPRPVNTGRHAREEPLLGADEQTEGRATRTAPRKASFVLGTILAIGAIGFAGCDDGKSKGDVPDAGWDAGSECTDCPDDTDSDVSELCGEPGSDIADNEALLAVGQKAVFTRSGRNIEVIEINEETGNVVVRLAEEQGEALENGHFGYEELNSEDPEVSIGGGEPEQTIALCGTEGESARLVTTRENGFVHCADVESGADSVPVYNELNDGTEEVLITNTHSEGEFAEDGDVEDCDPTVTTLMKQYITFQTLEEVPSALGARNNLLLANAETLKVHRLDDSLLVPFDVDLLEANPAAGTVKIATGNLGFAILQLGHSMEAGDLRITLNGFNGNVPDFSYGSVSDPDAEIWTTDTENPNEIEVNVLSGDVTTIYVPRFSDNKGDDMVDVKVFAKSAISVLGSGSETNLNGDIYTSETETCEAGITKITLTPVD